MRAAIIVFCVSAALGCDRGPEVDMSERSETPSAMADNPALAKAKATKLDPHAGLMTPAPNQPGQGGPPQVSRTAPQLAGVRWDAIDPLTWRAPSNAMRAAEYVVGEGESQALMTVSHFPGMGGRVSDNIARWVGQIRNDEGGPLAEDEVRIDTRTENGMEVTTVDATGTFVTSMGGPPTPQSNWRLLGAIVAAPEGPVFFKMIGPASTVQEAQPAFENLLSSLAPTN